MLAKTADYFADGEDVREAQSEGSLIRWQSRDGPTRRIQGYQERRGGLGALTDESYHIGAGRNLRDVWTFATQPYPGAHFATFPEELVRRCILISTPEKVCAACEVPWARVVEREPDTLRPRTRPVGDSRGKMLSDFRAPGGPQQSAQIVHSQTLGFRATCGCKAAPRPAVVLDPFCGSGTVSVVARKLGRHSVGIDVSAHYIEMAHKRLETTQPLLPLIP